MHRTTINLPELVLREAQEAYGTTSPTVAITRALEEAVARLHRQRLLEMDWSDLTPAAVAEMRRPRAH
jgi:Arc/MetJ family transcription regulator